MTCTCNPTDGCPCCIYALPREDDPETPWDEAELDRRENLIEQEWLRLDRLPAKKKEEATIVSTKSDRDDTVDAVVTLVLTIVLLVIVGSIFISIVRTF